MELTVRRLGVLSLGKIMGALYAVFGLIFGALFSLFSLIGMGIASASGSGEDAFVGMLFGIGAIVILPIVYGVFGFLGGLLTALLFNLVAGVAGGLEMEVEGALPAATGARPMQPASPALP